MSGKVDIREFAIDDYDAALDLWKRVEGIEIAEGDSKEEVAQFLARNPGLGRAAVVDSQIVGVALCGHDGRRGHIYHLAVEPTYRGGGIARRLVDECLEGLRRTGLKRAIILVANDNPPGREFWRRCGWEELPGAMAMGIDL
ncbi:MAG: GNAT family N-acetyltransferase [Chthoniobacterales bacterium]